MYYAYNMAHANIERDVGRKSGWGLVTINKGRRWGGTFGKEVHKDWFTKRDVLMGRLRYKNTCT